MEIETIVTIITSVIAAASILANLTPTDKDNKAIAAITKIVNLLALNLRGK